MLSERSKTGDFEPKWIVSEGMLFPGAKGKCYKSAVLYAVEILDLCMFFLTDTPLQPILESIERDSHGDLLVADQREDSGLPEVSEAVEVKPDRWVGRDTLPRFETYPMKED